MRRMTPFLVLLVTVGAFVLGYIAGSSRTTPAANVQESTLSVTAITPAETPEPTAVAQAVDLMPVGQDGDWTLIFHDEFESRRLDTEKWSTCYWWDDNGCTNEGNDELQWYMPDDILLEDDILKLRAREREIEASNDETYDYTSGMITTGQPNYKEDPAKFVYKYGYAEISARVPTGRGLWPAFWMLPNDFTSKPEIDVLEILGHEPDIIHMGIHYLDEDEERQRESDEWQGPDFSEDFHIYAVDWTPTEVVWYVDGEERFRFEDQAFIPDKTLYILLNLAVGGEYPGDPDEETVFPAYYEIDYVRVWQRVE